MAVRNRVEVGATPASCPLMDPAGEQHYEQAFRSAALLAGHVRSFLLGHSQEEQAAWLESSIAASLFQPWSMEILFATGLRGSMRFSEYQRLLGISPRTLSARLKDLHEAAFLERTVHDEVPVRITYALSGHGNATAVFAIPLLTHLHRQAMMQRDAGEARAPDAGPAS